MIFFWFFCRNRNLMVPRACNTRFLEITVYSNRRRYSTFKYFRVCSLLSQRWNPFRVCWVRDEIRSAYVQQTVCLAVAAQCMQLGTSLADSLAWLHRRWYCFFPVLLQYTGEGMYSLLRLDYSIRLARHLVRVHNFKSPAWTWTRHSDNIEGLRGTVYEMYVK
jgi:hypothetical protein